MARKPRTPTKLHIGHARYPSIKEARERHNKLPRDSDERRKASLRSAGDQMGPLIAAEMESQQLSKRPLLDDLTKQILFKLSHPDSDFSDERIRSAIGVTMTDEERQSHIERAQGQADALSGLLGDGTADSYKGVSQETIDFNRSLEAHRRWSLWAAYQRADLDENAKIDANKIAAAYRYWKTERMFYLCVAMEKLIDDLEEMENVQLNELRCIYPTNGFRLSSPLWRGRNPNIVLATAIITASKTDDPNSPYQPNPKLAGVLVKAYARYIAASNIIKRRDPNAEKAKQLKLGLYLSDLRISQMK